MSDELHSLMSQAASAILGAVIAAMVGVTLPQPFRTLAMLAVAVWLIAFNWIGRKPGQKDVCEMIKYLDELYKHDPQLICDGDYYRRMNRLIVLDGLSTRQLTNRRLKTKGKTDEGQQSGNGYETNKTKSFTGIVCFVMVFILPIAHGALWAPCRVGAFSNTFGSSLGTCLSLVVVLIVVSSANYVVVRRLLSPSVNDYLTFVFGGVFLWGIGYLATFLLCGPTSMLPLLLSLSISLYGICIISYLPYRLSIDKSIRRKLECLIMYIGISFYCVGLRCYAYLFVAPIDFSSLQDLLPVFLVALSGCGCLWFSSLQRDLVLDLVVDSCGDTARCRLLTDRVDELSAEVRLVMGSITGLLSGTALFAVAMSICTVLCG